MFGFKNKDELFSVNVSDLYLNPEDRINFYKKIKETGFAKNQELQLKKKNGEAFVGEFQNKTKSGEVYWESAHIFPLKNEKMPSPTILRLKRILPKGKN